MCDGGSRLDANRGSEVFERFGVLLGVIVFSSAGNQHCGLVAYTEFQRLGEVVNCLGMRIPKGVYASSLCVGFALVGVELNGIVEVTQRLVQRPDLDKDQSPVHVAIDASWVEPDRAGEIID